MEGPFDLITKDMGSEFRYALGKVLRTQDRPTLRLASHHCVLCLNHDKNMFNTCTLTHTHTSIHLSKQSSIFWFGHDHLILYPLRDSDLTTTVHLTGISIRPQPSNPMPSSRFKFGHCRSSHQDFDMATTVHLIEILIRPWPFNPMPFPRFTFGHDYSSHRDFDQPQPFNPMPSPRFRFNHNRSSHRDFDSATTV